MFPFWIWFLQKKPLISILHSVYYLLAVVIQYRLYRSKTGKYFLAIREDEDAAATLGVNIGYYKTIAVVIGGALAGVGGGFYVMYVTFIDAPSIFNLAINLEIVMVAPIIGGLGTLIGPILGSLINKPVAEIMRVAFMNQIRRFQLGCVWFILDDCYSISTKRNCPEDI